MTERVRDLLAHSRETSIATLEDRLISHLQTVLDSDDAEAKRAIDEVLGLITQLGEGIVTEDQVRARIDKISSAFSSVSSRRAN